ncbi:hypothetical protein B0H19DRAFT_1061514 [Mycena capillaripes]|nr:hypothetical protein B0H19DRAFT_1061514 [Mycena capillaripes]
MPEPFTVQMFKACRDRERGGPVTFYHHHPRGSKRGMSSPSPSATWGAIYTHPTITGGTSNPRRRTYKAIIIANHPHRALQSESGDTNGSTKADIQSVQKELTPQPRLETSIPNHGPQQGSPLSKSQKKSKSDAPQQKQHSKHKSLAQRYAGKHSNNMNRSAPQPAALFAAIGGIPQSRLVLNTPQGRSVSSHHRARNSSSSPTPQRTTSGSLVRYANSDNRNNLNTTGRIQLSEMITRRHPAPTSPAHSLRPLPGPTPCPPPMKWTLKPRWKRSTRTSSMQSPRTATKNPPFKWTVIEPAGLEEILPYAVFQARSNDWEAPAIPLPAALENIADKLRKIITDTPKKHLLILLLRTHPPKKICEHLPGHLQEPRGAHGEEQAPSQTCRAQDCRQSGPRGSPQLADLCAHEAAWLSHHCNQPQPPLMQTSIDDLDSFKPHANAANRHNICAECKLDSHPAYACAFMVHDKAKWGPTSLQAILKSLRDGDSDELEDEGDQCGALRPCGHGRGNGYRGQDTGEGLAQWMQSITVLPDAAHQRRGLNTAGRGSLTSSPGTRMYQLMGHTTQQWQWLTWALEGAGAPPLAPTSPMKVHIVEGIWPMAALFESGSRKQLSGLPVPEGTPIQMLMHIQCKGQTKMIRTVYPRTVLLNQAGQEGNQPPRENPTPPNLPQGEDNQMVEITLHKGNIPDQPN